MSADVSETAEVPIAPVIVVVAVLSILSVPTPETVPVTVIAEEPEVCNVAIPELVPFTSVTFPVKFESSRLALLSSSSSFPPWIVKAETTLPLNLANPPVPAAPTSMASIVIALANVASVPTASALFLTTNLVVLAVAFSVIIPVIVSAAAFVTLIVALVFKVVAVTDCK